ncbi:MAG: anion transporter [Nitrospiraceae bacterium]|nr:anion transporter [Nitrospiraceae bacterium]
MKNLPGIAALIFTVTYAGIALGGVPGLAIDRTGIALLGAIAMVATGAMLPREAALAVDFPTILLLYSLMVVSAQFRLGGFYSRAALRINRYIKNPGFFLGALMLVSAVFSALLANDIVCLAFTPVLCVSLLDAGLDPVPFLLGLACASNLGSAATIIGNPQNMLIGQVARLGFGKFLLWCAPPSALSLAACYGVVLVLYRGRWRPVAADSQPLEKQTDFLAPAGKTAWPPYDRHQTLKGLLITAALIAMFFTPVPRELSAIIAAGVLLASRKISTRSILGLVDWHLITLFCSLFIVVGGIVKYGLPGQAVAFLGSHGMNINHPQALSVIAVVLSNVVSNVPAVMLLLRHMDLGMTKNLYVLALASTYAGNLFIVGSIANLITIEQARTYGVKIDFREHARVGIPVTVISMLIAFVWIALAG